jgi:hypothetical protein
MLSEHRQYFSNTKPPPPLLLCALPATRACSTIQTSLRLKYNKCPLWGISGYDAQNGRSVLRNYKQFVETVVISPHRCTVTGSSFVQDLQRYNYKHSKSPPHFHPSTSSPEFTLTNIDHVQVAQSFCSFSVEIQL